MATQIGAGKLVRHGADRLRPEQLLYLVENEGEVNRIKTEIDEKRDGFLAAERALQAKADALDEVEENIARREAALAEAELALDARRVEGARSQAQSDAALSKRASIVAIREQGIEDRTATLDAREEALAMRCASREDGFAARETAFAKREAVLSVKERTVQARAAELDAHAQRLATVAGQLRDAAVQL